MKLIIYGLITPCFQKEIAIRDILGQAGFCMSNTPDNPIAIAYFSVEIGLDPAMRTYSGGLGVLAGDTLRAAADLGIPMVGVTLLHRKGYLRQHLDTQENQSESPWDWKPEAF